jgi:hypothetical protein
MRVSMLRPLGGDEVKNYWGWHHASPILLKLGHPKVSQLW